jgi:ATP-dependent Clp protease protease subunit
MIKLLARNRRKGTFRSESKGEEATIYLYDMIVDTDDEAEWWGGVSPQAFIKELNALSAPTIHLRVNSPGGSVFAARAIEQALREHKSQIIAHIDGLAASAASFLVMGADEIIAAPGSFIMIHKAWTIAWGNADDLVSTAALLEQIDGSLVKTYAARTKQESKQIADWMKVETWFEADKAAELGFVDSVAEAESAKAKGADWDLSAYDHAPQQPIAHQQPAEPDQPDRAALARAAAVRIAVPA